MTAAWIVRGDARQLPLADQSVQCIVTSPPYFSIRSYGGQTSVWGGDPGCPHGWATSTSFGMTGGTKKVGINGGRSTYQEATMFSTKHVGLCGLCGAMRCELGSEPHPDAFVAHLVEVFRECWRVLKDDGVAFLNMGSSYAGSGKGPTTAASTLSRGGGAKINHRTAQLRQGFVNQRSDCGIRPKSDMLIPFRLAIALTDDGWIVRQALIWEKPNPMPESVRDRWTNAHEYILMLVKSGRYFFDQDAIREPSTSPEQEAHNQRYARVYEASDAHAEYRQPGNVNNLGIHSRPGPGGRNGRSVWTIPTAQYPGAHYAVMPEEIVRRCVLAVSREGDVVLDPFGGSQTTAFVAGSLGRRGVGVELSAEYVQQARYGRLAQDFLPLETA